MGRSSVQPQKWDVDQNNRRTGTKMAYPLRLGALSRMSDFSVGIVDCADIFVSIMHDVSEQ